MANKSYNNIQKIKGIVREKVLSYNATIVEKYKEFLLSKWDGISSIIFYGSCLNEETRKETSTPDFFIVAKSYRAIHKKAFPSLFNAILTPNTYSIREKGLKGKYNIISMRDLSRETSGKAKDIYNLGRLSKRIAVIHHEDQGSLNTVIDSIASSYYSVADKVIFLVGAEFSLDDFIKAALSISYIGERRVEADDKIQKLYSSERDYYRSIYQLVLADLEASGAIRKENGRFRSNIGTMANKIGALRTAFFIRKSRIRAKLRWPKSMITFEGWVDTLVEKIERAQGIKLELTEREKKYPLIYCWKYYFRLKKDKKLK